MTRGEVRGRHVCALGLTLVACSFSGVGATAGGSDGAGETTSADASATASTTQAEGTTSVATTGGATSSSSSSATTPDTSDTSTTQTDPSTSSSTGEPTTETTGCAPTLWYPDGDDDGFGAGEPVESCEAPPDHADQAGDCDDGNPNINPGLDELCDGVDNNCNTLSDEWSPANQMCHECALGTFEGHFYALCGFGRSWGEARDDCQWRGGDLVLISGESENDYVFTEATKIAAASWWLGARDDFGWKWVDGAKVGDGWEHWADGQPGVFDNCMAMEGLGEWYSQGCGGERRFVCEITPP